MRHKSLWLCYSLIIVNNFDGFISPETLYGEPSNQQEATSSVLPLTHCFAASEAFFQWTILYIQIFKVHSKMNTENNHRSFRYSKTGIKLTGIVGFIIKANSNSQQLQLK